MSDTKPPRPGEVAIPLSGTYAAGLYFVGRIRTPWLTPADCPKNSAERRDVVATIELDPAFAPGLKDIERFSHLIALYWLDRSRRDLLVQAPRHLPAPRGVFALRSPVRPNPIGLSVVELVAVDGVSLKVRNLDCCDGTPLLDIKPYFASTDSIPDARRPDEAGT